MTMKKKKAAAVPAKASTPRIGQKNISEMWEADQEYMPPDVESDPRWRGVYLLAVTSTIGYVEMALGTDRAHPKGWQMVDQLRLEAEEAVRRLSPFEAASSTPNHDESPGPDEDARFEEEMRTDQGAESDDNEATQRPERFGFAISGQCGKPLGADAYCVREKHHKGLPCSPLEADAGGNLAEEMWAEHQEGVEQAGGLIEPGFKYHYLMGLSSALCHVQVLFEDTQSGRLTKSVRLLRDLIVGFDYDVDDSLNAEIGTADTARACPKHQRVKQRRLPKLNEH